MMFLVRALKNETVTSSVRISRSMKKGVGEKDC